ncbi:MAG: nicotinate-nucleotide diphosphorylase (carboxylating), partial [Nitrososphaeria archaeon]|nr:nicotinate-nucleotide diphosphorylase (carboxylating) [Nitrososphaeria archaeon]
LTKRYVDLVRPFRVRIFDTRKTTPNLRILEKYAVRVGGGFNHRFGLDDGILIKDNHIKVGGGIKEAVERVRQRLYPLRRIEVEADSLSQAKEALEAKTDIIMLDNMSIEEIRKSVE